MNQKKIIVLAIFIFLLGGAFTALGLGYWHKHLRLVRLRAVYEAGLHPIPSRFDIFCPEAELAWCDSLLRTGKLPAAYDSLAVIGNKVDALMRSEGVV